jgi:hypothetical protein
MPSPTTYQLHDWSIQSEVSLAAFALASPGGEEPDLQVMLGTRRPIPQAPPLGEPLALLDEQQGLALCRTPAGFTLRFFGQCDFDLDEGARRLTICVDPNVDPQIAELLLTSSALSFLLELRGHCVIHASAVVHRDSAVAFMGPSGSGKSSLAAALCALGAPLLSDDVLRIHSVHAAHATHCNRGSLALRLRPDARPLLQLFPDATPSIDERFVVHAVPASQASYPLACLLAPEFGDQLQLVRLSGVDACAAVLKAARVASWCSATRAARQFEALALLARSLPVYRLELPAGLLDLAPGRQQLFDQVARVVKALNR